MQINRVPSYNTNFTSKIYITNYKTNDYYDQKFYNSENFLKEVKKLEDNGNDDIVVFSTTQTGLHMTVNDGRNISYSMRIRNPYKKYNDEYRSYTIADVYKGCIDALAVQSKYETVPDKLKKYILT